MHFTDAPGNDSGRYVEGNPFVGIPSTLVGAKALNMFQDELANPVIAAGAALDDGNNAQLLAAILVLADQQAGAVLHNALAPGALSVGDPAVIAGSFGVALDAAAGASDPIRLRILGTVSLPKTSADTIQVGTRVYWTGTAVTTTSGGNRPIGVGAVQALPGSTVCSVRLEGISV